MSIEEFSVSELADPNGSIGRPARPLSHQMVRAALPEGQSRERRIEATSAVVSAALAEGGVDGLAEVAVELSLQMASALERIASHEGIAAVDLAEVWLID